MIYFLYPNKDATIYKQRGLLELNSGYDEILEIKKINTDANGLVLSRILLEFDDRVFTENKNKLLNSEFFLNLKVASSSELSINDTLCVYPLKKKWDEGTGRYTDTTDTEFFYEGASWRYADASKNFWKDTATTENYIGGGDFYEHSEILHQHTSVDEGELMFHFKQAFSDVRINITSIVKSWLSGDIKNNGILVKFLNETSDTHSSIKFFSKDTNTIYYPYLEVMYDDFKFQPCENTYYKTIVCETKLCSDDLGLSENIDTTTELEIDNTNNYSGSLESFSIESGSLTSGSLESFSMESGSIELESGSIISGSLESFSMESGSIISGSSPIIDSGNIEPSINSNTQCSNENNTSGTYQLNTEQVVLKKSSIRQLISEDFIPTIKSIRKEYKQTERKKIRLGVRSKRPIKTFSSRSDYSLDNFVTHDMYYSVHDSETQEKIIDFSKFTRVSCDANGHYFNFDFGCLAVGRFYTFSIKTDIDSEIEVHTDTRNFTISS